MSTIVQFTAAWRPDRSIADLLKWPCDVFAWTSTLLQTTGLYRYWVSPPAAWPSGEAWLDEVDTAAVGWLDYVCGYTSAPPDAVLEAAKVLESTRLTLDQLRRSETGGRADAAVVDVARAIFALHAMADRTGEGFGSPGIPGARAHRRAQFLADILLARHGSLTTLPREVGIVLPKMRTPQTGVSLRALSLYLTYHQTEVDVVWRSIPWVNIDDQTLNVLAIPWPFEMHPSWFSPQPRSAARMRTRDAARFFSYEPTPEIAPDFVVRLLKKAREHVHRVHVVVLPEAALSIGELAEVKRAVANEAVDGQVPLIVTGLRGRDADAEPLTGRTEDRESANRIVLSVFFAEKWYDLKQEKHHRWKLDKSQIQQYGLGGVLPIIGDWWEGIPIGPRRITFFAPNDWLVLAPLICEDLAQMDPVAELIRGVGPTLVWALLLDGPQLAQRWPARYASVLADDPGCSVLTLTSLGMAKASRGPDGKDGDRTVALWKDVERGVQCLQLPAGKPAASLLTLSATWHREFALDGRYDGESAARFVLSGATTIEDTAVPIPIAAAEVHATGRRYKTGGWRDIRELTAFTQLVDGIFDADADSIESFCAWALDASRVSKDDLLWQKCPAARAIVGIISQYDVGQVDWEFPAATELLRRFLKDHAAPKEAKDSWRRLLDMVDSISRGMDRVERGQLECLGDVAADQPASDRARCQLAVWMALLWAMHTRLLQPERDQGQDDVPGLVARIRGLLARRFHDVIERLAAA